MPAYRKPKEKNNPVKSQHNPNDCLSELSMDKPCDFCESSPSQLSNDMKDTEKIIMRTVESVDSKLSKSSKGGKSSKATKSAPAAKKKQGASPAGGPLCEVEIYKFSLCEILLYAIVLVLLIVVVRQACKIFCCPRRRRRRSC